MDIDLIPLEEEHLEIVRNWRNSKEVSQYMYTDTFITEDAQKKWFKKISISEDYKYWIISYDDKLLGVVNLYDIDKKIKEHSGHFLWRYFSKRGRIGGKVEYHVLSYVF